MKIATLPVGFALLTWLSPLLAKDVLEWHEAWKIDKRGRSVIRGDGGRPFVLTLMTDKRPTLAKSQLDAFLDSGYLFGASHPDDLVVTFLSVRWGNAPELSLAPSSYSDLFNPTSWFYYPKGERLVLVINGGDAASSYRAELEVAPHGVAVRRVHNRKSGYEEVTNYSYPRHYIESKQHR